MRTCSTKLKFRRSCLKAIFSLIPNTVVINGLSHEGNISSDENHFGVKVLINCWMVMFFELVQC